MIRTIYNLKGGYINSISTEAVNVVFPYGIYLKENYLFVNSIRKKLSKNAILLDLRSISRRINNDMLNGVFGMTNTFLKSLEEYSISSKEVKEAMENGKNFYKDIRRNSNYVPRSEIKGSTQSYTVG